jgi:hypothetical protein
LQHPMFSHSPVLVAKPSGLLHPRKATTLLGLDLPPVVVELSPGTEHEANRPEKQNSLPVAPSAGPKIASGH